MFFYSAATRNNIYIQTIGKANSAGFKTQNLKARFLSRKGLRSFKIFLVTLRYSPASAILNGTPACVIFD